jgi:aminopeptidase 2
MLKNNSFLVIFIFTTIFNVVTSTPLWLHRKEIEHKPPQFKALSDYLLTDNVLPIHYNIDLYPYILTPPDKNFTFDGKVIIDISVNKEDTKEIKLHAYDIVINTLTVKKIDDGSMIDVNSHTIADDDTNFLIINLASNVVNGFKYQIEIVYTGVLNNDLEGFYRSTYNNSAGEQK